MRTPAPSNGSPQRSARAEILTNNHVIRGATTSRSSSRARPARYTAQVVGYDVAGDVAVLPPRGASNLETVTIGDSSKVAVGERVRAVGNAGGTGTLTSVTGR